MPASGGEATFAGSVRTGKMAPIAVIQPRRIRRPEAAIESVPMYLQRRLSGRVPHEGAMVAHGGAPTLMGEHVSVTELITKIEAYLTKSSDDPIARLRWVAVRDLGDALKSGDYPTREHDQLDLSLIPAVFQEANWDGIDWGSRDTMGHHQLRDILEIDFLTQMAGQRREEASDSDIETYRLRSLRAISWHQEWSRRVKRERGGS